MNINNVWRLILHKRKYNFKVIEGYFLHDVTFIFRPYDVIGTLNYLLMDNFCPCDLHCMHYIIIQHHYFVIENQLGEWKTF